MSTRCFFLERHHGDGPALYKRSDTGEVIPLCMAPAGAMWYADWMLELGSSWWRGPYGHCLMVRVLENFDWCPDRRASNCTLPNDNDHKCWVRHGTPPNITVDKDGRTCSAGAGSIVAPDWHGFLRNGVLEP